MTREATLALGGWYRHDRDRSGRERYAKLVAELSQRDSVPAAGCAPDTSRGVNQGPGTKDFE